MKFKKINFQCSISLNIVVAFFSLLLAKKNEFNKEFKRTLQLPISGTAKYLYFKVPQQTPLFLLQHHWLDSPVSKMTINY